MFQNLIDNALKYAKPSTVVRVTARPVGEGRLSAAVSDEGDGIPAGHLRRLTERFYRVDTARSRQLGGTGLGLAIVKHVVNRHRGRLDIQSTPGKGSTFTVTPSRPPDGANFRPAPPQAGLTAVTGLSHICQRHSDARLLLHSCSYPNEGETP